MQICRRNNAMSNVRSMRRDEASCYAPLPRVSSDDGEGLIGVGERSEGGDWEPSM